MQKVQMTIHGKQALVDADMVSKVARKSELVSLATALQSALSIDDRVIVARPALQQELVETMRKIQRLNKTIRQNVQFI